MKKTRNVGIYLFEGMELLDFAGPYEVFTMVNQGDPSTFNVYTVSENQPEVRSFNGLVAKADYTFRDSPQADILVIPGGINPSDQLANERVLNWIKEQSDHAEITLSVCTGTLLLAKIGLLKGLSATTHHMAYDLLVELAPDTNIDKGKRFIDNGKIVTSAGVSAGIDSSLYVVSRLLGQEVAIQASKTMEYVGNELHFLV